MRFHALAKSVMLPHILVVSQWIVLTGILVFNVNFSILVTGALGNGGLKAITLFHLWTLFFSIVLFLVFFLVRKEGIAEKSIAVLSLMTVASSIVTVYFHFVDNFIIPLKAAEIIVWSLYNGVFAVSVYKILVVFLLPMLKK